MSTIEDFENAPVGATATHGGSRAMKMDGPKRYWVLQNGLRLNDKEMEHWDYTLDPFNRVSPTTAREALDLAWELAHPVKEGQTIPDATRLVLRDDYGLLREDEVIGGWRHLTPPTDNIRTLDPIPNEG